MIDCHTVFVIGAGAHVPYGFPDGRKLIDDITKLLPTPDDHKNTFRSMFCEAYYREKLDLGNAFSHFRKLLDNGSHTSIDSFLATHVDKKGFPEIGKFAVANVLLPLEFKGKFSRSLSYNERDITRAKVPDADWLSHLIQKMCSGCHSPKEFVEKNRVSFVTFNYDRTLEHFLCARVADTYDISAESAWDAVKQIPIKHVYGSLGDFQPGLPNEWRDKNFYGEDIRTAAESIRLMYEDRSQHSEIEEARKLFLGPGKVCFLGFSFDGDNIARLELNTLCEHRETYASRYNVPDGEWAQVENRMQPANVNSWNSDRKWDALTFLRESRALV